MISPKPLVMSDRVVVMDKAVIQQVGDPQEIYANPANSFVANFIGVTSLLEGKLDARDGEVCSVDVSMGQGAEPLRLRAGAAGATPGDRLMSACVPRMSRCIWNARRDGSRQSDRRQRHRHDLSGQFPRRSRPGRSRTKLVFRSTISRISFRSDGLSDASSPNMASASPTRTNR